MSVSSVSKVTAKSSNFPNGKLSWETKLSDPTGVQTDEDVIKYTLLYNNLMYDLVGLALGKLGWEYSKLLVGEQSREEFVERMSKVQRALSNEG